MSSSDKTVLHSLETWSIERPQAVAGGFLHHSSPPSLWSFGELHAAALGVAEEVAQRVRPGEPVLLVYPPCKEFVFAFFGAMLAGAVPVPLTLLRPNRHVDKFVSVVRDSGAQVALTSSEGISMLHWLTTQPQLASLQWHATDAWDRTVAAKQGARRASADQTAFMQYTSGSTSDPKGVVVTHGNLWHNNASQAAAMGNGDHTVTVSWLPLFHDMGLIGNLIQSVFLGTPCYLMSPLDFLQRPMAWLEAISTYRATMSGAPNFAYDLCVAKARPEVIERIDLSSWAVAFNGAETVRAHTMEAFTATFARAGFRSQAFFPCYGMAEATLFMSGLRRESPRVIDVDADALSSGWATKAGGGRARAIVSCGVAWDDHRIAVVDPASRQRCENGQVGEVWFQGLSVADGYFGQPAKTAEVFHARIKGEESAGDFLRTGDLGFVLDGELYITGRCKDVIVIRGRNYYPQDIESTAERAHRALEIGGGAAFSVESVGGATERLVILHQVQRETPAADRRAIVDAVREAITREHELSVAEVVLLQPGTLLKTSSGKVRRDACRTAYLQGQLSRFGEEEGVRAVPATY
jgi:acyl-CoA synthetase (AMP-forming)/AMP-acid ligase II